MFFLAIALAAPVGIGAPAIDLKEGDRIAFIGNTFVEREQNADYIETVLLSRFPDRNITFRNLGYSADTSTGDARGLCTGWATFEAPDQAFERLRKLVAEFKPTVLMINYGMTESFAGPEQLAEFSGNYNKMLDALSKAAGTSPQAIFLSPNFHEDLGKPLPNPSAHNKNLRLYSDAIARIATQRGGVFVDLMAITEAAGKLPSGTPLTWNGIHLTAYGYWRVALGLETSLGYSPRRWEITMAADGVVANAVGTQVTEMKALPTGVTFTASDALLPIPAAPKDSPKGIFDGTTALPGTDRILRVSGLKTGTYELKAGEDVVGKASAEQWGKGVNLKAGPQASQVEALRQKFIAKDFNYFAYQRPENDAYILAFRRGEQGRNAVEIPRFLPFVEEKEKEIAKLRVPTPVAYSLQLAK